MDREDGEVQSEVRATPQREEEDEERLGSTDAETPTKPQWMKP
jgi:hypothetical protein